MDGESTQEHVLQCFVGKKRQLVEVFAAPPKLPKTKQCEVMSLLPLMQTSCVTLWAAWDLKPVSVCVCVWITDVLYVCAHVSCGSKAQRCFHSLLCFHLRQNEAENTTLHRKKVVDFFAFFFFIFYTLNPI